MGMHFVSLHDVQGRDGTVQLQKKSGASTKDEIILHPSPSPSDPNDPLRWPTWRKYTSFGTIIFFSFLVNWGAGGFGPAFYILSQQFGKSETEITSLSLWTVFTLGLFNFFWVPIGNYIGRRPVFIFASLLSTCCWIWAARASSFESLLWARIVAAFAGSSSEALGAATVNDLFFLHERTSLMGLYTMFVSTGNSIGPLVNGFIVEGLGWQWCNWVIAILTGINAILIVFLFPETRYLPRTEKATNPCADSSLAKKIMHNSPEQTDVEPGTVMGGPNPKHKISRHAHTELGIANIDLDAAQSPQQSYSSQLNPFSGRSKENIFFLFARPWTLIVHPAVLLAAMSYAITLAWIVFINVINPFVLQSPPYNWSPAINGLINIPAIIGNIFGAFLGGWLVDRYCLWASKRNDGIFEPEMRLVMLIFPILLMPAGCLAFGYGVARELNWTALFLGYGMMSVALDAIPSITMTYLSDCLLPVAPDALLLVNGLKNLVAFGFLYAVIPWVQLSGYIDVLGTQAGLYIALVGLPSLGIWYCGKKLRQVSGSWKIILTRS